MSTLWVVFSPGPQRGKLRKERSPSIWKIGRPSWIGLATLCVPTYLFYILVVILLLHLYLYRESFRLWNVFFISKSGRGHQFSLMLFNLDIYKCYRGWFLVVIGSVQTYMLVQCVCVCMCGCVIGWYEIYFSLISTSHEYCIICAGKALPPSSCISVSSTGMILFFINELNKKMDQYKNRLLWWASIRHESADWSPDISVKY